LAREYGWTSDYILNNLSKKEVMTFAHIITERFDIQAESYEKAGKNEEYLGDISEVEEQDLISRFNVKVK
jgi:RNA binding exosome subunit